MNGYDVVVVGGRVAGASTALLLARAGVQVVLIDRDVTVGADGIRSTVARQVCCGANPDRREHERLSVPLLRSAADCGL
jgi:glycine/D-amino acid oxidase-like deaminating enzyme